MASLTAFMRLARPKFLLGGFLAFALGAAVAAADGARILLATYLGGQTMVTAFHLMTHFANDYFDRGSDRFGTPSAFAGGSGVLVTGELAPRVALVAALLCAAGGIAAVVGFALRGNLAAAALGSCIGALAWMYSAPPVRLAARGWGEIDTAAIVAVLVPIAADATLTRAVHTAPLAATAAPALAMFVMMLAVEWPDRGADAAGGKINLVVRLGERGAARLATGCALLIAPALAAPIVAGAPASLGAFAILILPLTLDFAQAARSAGLAASGTDPGADQIAARGVTLFIVTVTYALLGYLGAIR